MEAATEAEQPAAKPKRTRVPAAKPTEILKEPSKDGAFELQLTGPGTLRKLEPKKWTKDEENRDVIDVRFSCEITGDECLDGVPYPTAAKALLEASQGVTDGIDQSSLRLKKNYASVLVLLNDPLFKCRLTVTNCTVSTTPEIAIVKGRPRVRVGFSGQVFANDLLPLTRMLGRDIAIITEPAQQSLI